MFIEIPPKYEDVSEATLLSLAARCAQVQAAALSELQARPGRNREAEERLAALPTWRRSLVQTLSSKWIMVIVCVVVGLGSLAASALEFANNSADLQRVAREKAAEFERLQHHGAE